MSFPPKVNYGALNLICYFAIVYIYTLYGKLFSVLLGVTLITVLDRCQPSSAVSGRFSLGLSGRGKKTKTQWNSDLSFIEFKNHCLWVCSGENSCVTVSESLSQDQRLLALTYIWLGRLEQTCYRVYFSIFFECKNVRLHTAKHWTEGPPQCR